MRKQKSIAALFFLCSFLFLFCSASLARTPSYGGRLVLSTISDPKSFNDIIAKESSTSTVTSLIFEGLVTVNAFDLRLEPNLAESWSVSEDGLVWRFFLRKDVRWNDGVPFTAEDVVFTFNDLIYNDDIPSSARDIFLIDGKKFSVKAVDPYSVEFVLPIKFAPFLRSMTQAILPKHKLEKSVKDKTFAHTWGIDTLPEEIVGTGAFMLEAYEPGQRIVFKRNPYYWKRGASGEALPYLDGVVYLIVQNADTALLKFLDGELDYYGLRGSDFPLLKPLEQKDHFTVYQTGPAFGTNFILFNQNQGVNPRTQKPFVDPKKSVWFRDLNFRKAAAHAIDKEKIIEILMNGLGYPQYSSISPAKGFWHNPDVVKYPYDLNKAKEILNQAGYRDYNGDGILEDRFQNDVEFNLYTNAGAQDRIQIAGIIRHDLESLGMKINFQVLEFNTLVAKLTNSFDWDAVILGLTGGGADPHFGNNVWESSAGLHMWYPGQSEPSTSWEARIDEIFLQAVQELDEDKRKALYDEFQVIISENVPLIYTVLSSNIFAVRDKFGNLNPSNYGGAFHNLEEIYIIDKKTENRKGKMEKN